MKKSVIILLPLFLVIVFFLIRQYGARDKNLPSQRHLNISNEELSEVVNQKTTFLKAKNSQVDKKTIEQDAKKLIIEAKIVNEYAKENVIMATNEEIENRYNAAFKGFNKNQKNSSITDEAFLITIKKLYGITKEDYLQQVRLDILKEKIQLRTGIPFTTWYKKEIAKWNFIFE